MAIAKPHYHQPHLEKLELPNAGFDIEAYPLPDRNEIDIDDVKFIVDVDLDDLTVFFADNSRPHYVDDVSDRHAILIDAETDQVTGMVLYRFLSEAVKLHPELVPILRYATIIAGTSLQEPEESSANPGHSNPGIISRMEDWLTGRARRQERLAAFTSFADLVGIN
jgi:hypothetical protein